jgi:hypothetical protein
MDLKALLMIVNESQALLMIVNGFKSVVNDCKRI